jgi:hypothetical protein
MFAYCREALLLSEREAYNRIEVARAARRFPIVLELLEDGAVSLTTVRLLAPHLTASNHVEVLDSARGLKRSQVEELVARLAPRPDVASTVRKLPLPKPVTAVSNATWAASASIVAVPLAVVSAVETEATPVPIETILPPSLAPRTASSLGAGRAMVVPLSPERYKLQLTIGSGTLEKLRLAKDLLRHAVPSGDEPEILDRALTALLTELAKKKFAASDRPARPRVAAGDSRHVPAEVKRAVFVRDLGRCAFVGSEGRRCGERAFVEFHHVQSYADGGCATIDNIELRCRRHNAYEWQQRCVDPSELRARRRPVSCEADGAATRHEGARPPVPPLKGGAARNVTPSSFRNERRAPAAAAGDGG